MNKEELKKIKQKALQEHIPIIMDETLEVIEKYLKENPPKKILEIGAAVGYSAMCFSEFLAEGGKIDTIEREEERIAEAKENFKKVGVQDVITLYEGDAVEILPTLKDKYDMVFIDAAKGKYPFFCICNAGGHRVRSGRCVSQAIHHEQKTAEMEKCSIEPTDGHAVHGREVG